MPMVIGVRRNGARRKTRCHRARSGRKAGQAGLLGGGGERRGRGCQLRRPRLSRRRAGGDSPARPRSGPDPTSSSRCALPPWSRSACCAKEPPLVCFLWPAQNPDLMQLLAARKATVLAMDSVPRISAGPEAGRSLFMASTVALRAASSCIKSGFCAGQRKQTRVAPSRSMPISTTEGGRTLKTMSDLDQSAAAPAITSAPAAR